MFRLRLSALQKCSKVIIQRTASSTPTTSLIATLISILPKGCVEGVRNNKSVIWKRHRAKKAVLLDNLCNNNLIIFEQSKERVLGFGSIVCGCYNNFALYLDERLKEYANFKDDVISWEVCFLPTFYNVLGIKVGIEQQLINQLCFLQQPDVQHERIPTNEVSGLPTPSFNAQNPFLAPITVNRELHKSGDRSCLHIELNIEGSNMSYEAGDHVAMYPVNDKKLVEKLGKLCEADLDKIISLDSICCTDDSRKHPFPYPISYRSALTHYLEITAKPTTNILKELTEFCTNEADKEFLCSMTFTTNESKQKYQSWIEDSCRNIVHILEDIKSCKPPIDYICKLLPRLQPRYYSISSSSKLYPNDVHITAVMVQYKTSTGRINKGVATAFLKEKTTSSGQVKVPIFISKSKFHLPAESKTPIIMVGAGTGLAPFRAFIQERQYLRDQGKNVGDTVLYFGCRKKSEDFIYKEELEKYVAKGTLTLRTAFSRDQEKKVYVTHLLEQEADLLWKIIGEKKGIFYICGDAKNIAVDVRNILVKIISTKGSMSEQDAVLYLKEMEAQKRYLADVWS